MSSILLKDIEIEANVVVAESPAAVIRYRLCVLA